MGSSKLDKGFKPQDTSSRSNGNQTESQKASISTEFDKSVAEVEQLLELTEVKLPKVGPNVTAEKASGFNFQKNSSSQQTNSSNSSSPSNGGGAQAAPQIDLAAQMKAEMDKLPKDENAPFKQKAMELGAADGKSKGTTAATPQQNQPAQTQAAPTNQTSEATNTNQATTSTTSAPANAQPAQLEKPTNASAMSKEQAEMYYKADYDKGYSMAFNKAFLEKQQADAIIAADQKKKADEEMRKSDPDYLKGKEDAQDVIAGKKAGADPSGAKNQSNYFKGFNEGHLAASYQKAAADKKAAESNPDFLEGKADGEADGKVKNPAKPKKKGNSEYERGYFKGFNSAYLGAQITEANEQRAAADKALNESPHYKKGLEIGQAEAKASQPTGAAKNYVDAQKLSAADQGFFYKGFNKAYLGEQFKQADARDYTKKPAFRRGRAMGMIAGSLKAKYPNEADLNAFIKDKLSAKLGGVSDLPQLIDAISKKSMSVAKPPAATGDLAEYENATTEEAKKAARAKLDSEQLIAYEKNKKQYDNSMEGLDNMKPEEANQEIKKRYDLGYNKGFNEGYLRGQQQLANAKNSAATNNLSAAYKMGKTQGEQVGRMRYEELSKSPSPAAQELIQKKIEGILAQAQAQGGDFYQGFLYGFNHAQAPDARADAQEAAQKQIKEKKGKKEYSSIVNRYKDSPETMAQIEELFKKHWDEAYKKTYDNYVSPYEGAKDSQGFKDRQTKAQLDAELTNNIKTASSKALDDQFFPMIAAVKGYTAEMTAQLKDKSNEEQDAITGFQPNEDQKKQLKAIRMQRNDFALVIGLSATGGHDLGIIHGISYAQGIEASIAINKGSIKPEAAQLQDQVSDSFLAANGNKDFFQLGMKEGEDKFGASFRLRQATKAAGVTDLEYFALPPRIRTEAAKKGADDSKKWEQVYMLTNGLQMSAEEGGSTENAENTEQGELNNTEPQPIVATESDNPFKTPKNRTEAVALTADAQYKKVLEYDKSQYLEEQIRTMLNNFYSSEKPDARALSMIKEKAEKFAAAPNEHMHFLTNVQTVINENKETNTNPKKGLIAALNTAKKAFDASKSNADAKKLADAALAVANLETQGDISGKKLPELITEINRINEGRFNGPSLYKQIEANINSDYVKSYGATYPEYIKNLSASKGISDNKEILNEALQKAGEEVAYVNAYLNKIAELCRQNNKTRMGIDMLQAYANKTTAQITNLGAILGLKADSSLPTEKINVSSKSLDKSQLENEVYKKACLDPIQARGGEKDAEFSYNLTAPIYRPAADANAPESPSNLKEPVLHIDNAKYMPSQGGANAPKELDANSQVSQEAAKIFDTATGRPKNLADLVRNTAFFNNLKKVSTDLPKNPSFGSFRTAKAVVDSDQFKIIKDSLKLQVPETPLENKRGWVAKFEQAVQYEEADKFAIKSTAKLPFEFSQAELETFKINFEAKNLPSKTVLKTDVVAETRISISNKNGKSDLHIAGGGVQINTKDPDKSAFKGVILSIPTLEAKLKEGPNIKSNKHILGAIPQIITEAQKKAFSQELSFGDNLGAVLTPIRNSIVQQVDTLEQQAKSNRNNQASQNPQQQ